MSKKQIIAVDIDDVLAANAEGFVAFSNERWGTNLRPEDYDDHWAKVWQIDNEETEKRSHEFHSSGVVGRYRHYDEAEAVLAVLSERYEMVVTTSRRQESVKYTTEWIARHFPGIFKDVHYAGMWDKVTEDSHAITKTELCRQIGADYLIDDQTKHCFAAAAAGIQAVLFGDYPWNQVTNLPDGVARAHNWQEVLEYFDGC